MASRHSWTLLAALQLLTVATSSGTTLPRFLTWKELQVVKVASKPNCECANTSGLERLVRPVGGHLCLPRSSGAAANLTVVDQRICFPADYGIGECRMWDAGVGACATEDPEPWCFQLWCYVDPNSCVAGDVSESVFFRKASGSWPRFSYMACGVPQEDNPYFTLWMPVHLAVAASLTIIIVPLVAFASWFFASRLFAAVVPLGAPWVLLWFTVATKWAIGIMQLSERVPRFPRAETVERVLHAVVLFFLLLGVHVMLTWVDQHMQHMRFVKHQQDHRRKQVQILESVLLYQQLHINSWADVLMDLWRPFYRVSQQVLLVIWVLTVLDFPVLSSWATSGLAATMMLILLGVLIGFKDDIVAAVVLAFERPFEVADIISLQTISNSESAMNAVAVGFVEKLGIAHIAIRNFDMRLQYVPTRVFVQGSIKNWTARQYKLSHWTLVMSMRTPPGMTRAFREGVEKVLKSHPSCKTDGYIKVCVKSLSAGGFLLEVVCFTKPHADHHAFKLDMNVAFSKLASRLGVDFVWQGISKETAKSTVPGFQYSGAEGDGGQATPAINDLLYEGRFTRGSLVGKFNKSRCMKLAKALEQAPSEASVCFDLMFSMPLSHPAIVADREIHWTEGQTAIKGELQVLVDEAMLKAIMPKRSIIGGAVEVFVVATVARRGGQPKDATAGEGEGGQAWGLRGSDQAAVPCIGTAETLATCRSHPHRLAKNGEVTWGETLALGEVAFERAGKDDKSCLVLQLAVGHVTVAGHFALIGIAEEPLLALVKDAWKDQRVKATLEGPWGP